MEVYERIRFLRKHHLKMTMEVFGGKLGVSRDVISNIELNRLAKPEQKLSLINLICKEFNINKDWILNGTEPMIMDSEFFSLEQFLKNRKATELEIKAIKAYFELEPNLRKNLLEHFKNKILEQ